MKRLISLGISAALLATLCSCHKRVEATHSEPIKVKAMIAEPSSVSFSRSFSGTVEESNGVALSFSVAGTIRQMHVNVGDRVAKGQLIATIDPSTLQNTYDIALATLRQAQDAYDRMRQLHEANSLPDMQWVQVENALSQAKSAEAIARKGLEDAKLYASRSGYVSERMADAGMNVAPGLPVVKIVDIGTVKVSVSVPENEISAIKPGQRAQVSVSALGGKVFTGTVNQKGISANPLSRSYDVKIDIANPGAELLPGMICDVALANEVTTESVTLPINAVLLDADNQNFVWICRQGHAEKRLVTVEGMNDSGIALSPEGIRGDTVIIEGLQKVSQGTPVEILKP